MSNPALTDHHLNRPRRWATRQEAMAYARIGATKMNDLMHGRLIFAKKLDGKVVVDLNSIDDFYGALPDVGASQ
jgi:hypothetical protein